MAELEARLAAFSGARRAVTCANGTDALYLALMLERVGPGDAVFVPAFTFAATAEPVVLLGASPVFVDVLADSYNVDPESLEAAVEEAKRRGLRPRAVIAVDLFGQPADYERLVPVARGHGLALVADAAQSFGACLNGRRVGTLADYTTTSFYPSKPLGCYGDGGAILLDDEDKAAELGSVRTHGKGSSEYDNVRLGMNSRLDTLQAAILLEKLAVLPEEIEARHRVAGRYEAALSNIARTPAVSPGAAPVWAHYTIRAANRDRVAAGLKSAGVPTAVYYPRPLTRQPAYARFPAAPGGVPVSERLSREVLSLPMHPYLEFTVQDRIIEALHKSCLDA